jgi:hypothetical protein
MTSKGMIAVVALLAAGGAAFADSGSRAEQAACRGDVRRLCGHIGRGDEQKYRDCLQSRFSELSQNCQKVLMDHQNQQ